MSESGENSQEVAELESKAKELHDQRAEE